MRVKSGFIAGCLLGCGALHAVGQRPKITSVSHLSVYTNDPAKSEHFYVYDLGATKGSDPQNPQGVRYYFNAIQFVEVLPLPAGGDVKNRFDHAGYNTTDAEALRQYLAAHNVPVPPGVTHGSDGSAYFEVKDPENNRVQFVQPPAHPAAVPDNPLSNHIIHLGYIVHNSGLEDGFYKGLLGFRPYWHGGMTDADTSQWISLQVPDGLDWVEYMTVKGPEKTMNVLYAGDRLDEKHSPPQIGRDGKWQLNLYAPDGTRAEMMEFQPSVKPCCSPLLAASPTK